MDYVIIYFVIALIFTLINTIIRGFKLYKQYDLNDIKDCLLWPLSMSILIGLLIRVSSESLKSYIKERKRKK